MGLNNDLRIHLPSILDIHLELDLISGIAVAYGSDCFLNGEEMRVRETYEVRDKDILIIKGEQIEISNNTLKDTIKDIDNTINTNNTINLLSDETQLENNTNTNNSKEAIKTINLLS